MERTLRAEPSLNCLAGTPLPISGLLICMITPGAMEKHTAAREIMVAPAELANKRGRTGNRTQVNPLVEMGGGGGENGWEDRAQVFT